MLGRHFLTCTPKETDNDVKAIYKKSTQPPPIFIAPSASFEPHTWTTTLRTALRKNRVKESTARRVIDVPFASYYCDFVVITLVCSAANSVTKEKIDVQIKFKLQTSTLLDADHINCKNLLLLFK